MTHTASPFPTIAAQTSSGTTDEVTAQRLCETQAAIAEQRRALDRLTDPAPRAVARRTLGALEDMLLIMTRTRRLLVER